MATKDAELASDYLSGYLELSNSSQALYEIELGAASTFQPGLAQELFLINVLEAELELSPGETPHGSGVAGAGVTYRMRGFDTNGAVNGIVYWDSTTVDSTALNYTGSAGPVINIIISDVIGD